MTSLGDQDVFVGRRDSGGDWRGREIGRGISRACASAGANLVITGRSPEPLADAANEIKKLGSKCLVVAGDITSLASIDAIVDRAQDRLGSIEGWVNNAGSASTSDIGPMLDLTLVCRQRLAATIFGGQ